MMSEENEALQKFKLIVEYFVNNSIFNIISQYEEIIAKSLSDESQKSKFTELLRNFRLEEYAETDLENNLKSILKPNTYEYESVYYICRLKSLAPLLLHHFKMLSDKYFLTIKKSLVSAERINLLKVKPDRKCTCEELYSDLSNIESSFARLNQELPYTKSKFNLYFYINHFLFYLEFIYSSNDTEYNESHLKKYINRGEEMMKSPSFEGSPIQKLEQIIKEPSKVVLEDAFIKNQENRPQKIAFERTFIALVAPSLCGKTQSAFAMKEMRPLYFALNEDSIKENGKSQPIYANFDSLNRIICEAGSEDLQTIKAFEISKSRNTFQVVETDESILKTDEKLKLSVVEKCENLVYSANDSAAEYQNIGKKLVYSDLKSIYARVSCTSLLKDFKDKKFFTLGLLIALMEDAESKYNENNVSKLISGKKMSWIEFFAKRDDERKEFYFSAVSIDEAIKKKKLFKKYFLFLDEFVGFPWSVLVRNICRAIGMRVLVANTNSDIANLTGKSQEGFSSRESGILEVWSIIVTRLNKTIKNEADKDYKLLLTKIDELVDSMEENGDRKGLKLFFEDFITKQFFTLRPGVLEFVRDVIVNFHSKRSESAHLILDTIVRDLGTELLSRKVRIKSTQGRLANMGLYLSNAYYNKNPEEPNNDKNSKESIFHKSSYLMEHLYYLENPVDNEDWMFLSFYPAAEDSDHLQIYVNNDFRPWISYFTYFDVDELLTVLGCMSIISPNSVIHDAMEGILISSNSSVVVSSSPNPYGNRLELISAVSIIESSQHNYQSRESTLRGQSCVEFVKNIVINLRINLNSSENRRQNSVKVIFTNIPEKKFDLESFLLSFSVPFLFALNCQVPNVLKELSDLGVINVGYCTRTPDKEKIDFKFQISSSCFDSDSSKLIHENEKFYCIAECKNWAAPILVYDLIDIIQKSYDIQTSCINLIFCNYLKDFNESDFKKLFSAVSKGLINIFKLEKVVGKPSTFTWKNIAGDFENPEFVVLIFELDVINCM